MKGLMEEPAESNPVIGVGTKVIVDHRRRRRKDCLIIPKKTVRRKGAPPCARKETGVPRPSSDAKMMSPSPAYGNNFFPHGQ
jgi:hypothetical protein